MEAKNENKHLNEYQVGNTLYQVAPIFTENAKEEDIKGKILHLILHDRERKSMKT